MFKTKIKKTQHKYIVFILYIYTILSMALRTIHSFFGCRGLAKRILSENPAEKNYFTFQNFII